MTPRFFYFDFGKVLVDFSVERMCRQMADVAGIDAARVREAVFDGRLQHEYEMGRLTSRQFHEAFCRKTGSCAEYEPLAVAASDIFSLNASMIPVVSHLRAAGHRLGILSNTCENHWEHCLRRFPILGELFEVHALSYRIGAAKPEAAIFLAAAHLAGVTPRDVFFTDDTAGHVAGAFAAGFDAVQYTSTPELVAELRKRGVRFNY